VSGTVEPGAFRERTLLAWMRTTLAFAGCGLLVAHLVQVRHPTAGPAAALFGLAVAGGLTGAALARYRAPARRAGSAGLAVICVAAAASVALAGAALLAVLTG
jgi:uncharacterized membrane protein YidH (DUF202 family)